MQSGVERRGEWLELRLLPLHSSTLDELLLGYYQIPLKLLQKLKQQDGIRLKMDSVLLKLFPPEIDEYATEWVDIDILFEDDFCLVVNKPAGMAVHPGQKDQTGTLANAVAAYYQASGQPCRVRHIHRLDEDTTGAVLYAKNEFAHICLDEQMRLRSIHRQYIAFVKGRVQPLKGRIDAPIGRDRHHPSRRRISPTGNSAVTEYEVSEVFDHTSLLRLHLETGRTHQIRVHLSHLQHPLLGDALYGGPTDLIERHALHGESLAFPHPLLHHKVEVYAPWPTDLIHLHDRLQLKILKM